MYEQTNDQTEHLLDSDREQQHYVKSFCQRLCQCFTVHDLTLHQYKLLLLLCLAMNIIFLITQVGRTVYIIMANKIAADDSFALMILVAILTFLMSLVLLRLLVHPRPKLALFAVLLVIVTTILFIVEFVIFFQQINDVPLFMSLWLLFILLEAYSAIVYYRYWELILFNYDGYSQDSDSNNRSRSSLHFSDTYSSTANRESLNANKVLQDVVGANIKKLNEQRRNGGATASSPQWSSWMSTGSAPAITQIISDTSKRSNTNLASFVESGSGSNLSSATKVEDIESLINQDTPNAASPTVIESISSSDQMHDTSSP